MLLRNVTKNCLRKIDGQVAEDTIWHWFRKIPNNWDTTWSEKYWNNSYSALNDKAAIRWFFFVTSIWYFSFERCLTRVQNSCMFEREREQESESQLWFKRFGKKPCSQRVLTEMSRSGRVSGHESLRVSNEREWGWWRMSVSVSCCHYMNLH